VTRARLILAVGVLVVVVIVVVVATRGGDEGGNGSQTSLSASLTRAKAELSGRTVVASVRARIGGIPGSKLTLKWGLVDSLSGRASVQDRVARSFTSTSAAVTRDVVIRFPRPATPSHYIINFALYGPNGALVNSTDTGELVVPE
jgi:hypothetical protein